MKKTLSLLLALAMCLGLAACGPKSSGSQSSSQDQGSGSGAQVIGGADGSTGILTTDSDLAYVQNKGTLVVGITNFEPMDYQNENGEWIGFDADMAKAFAASLGVEVEFSEITWDYKVMELDTKKVDCLWNGMTLTPEVKSSMSTSEPYCLNAQVVVVPADKADQFQSLDSLNGINIAVESGSAGEAAAQALGATTVPVQSQANTLLEVASGTSDAAVIDLLMAGAMVGEGTSYANLTYTINLNGEEYEQYGVGFRKGSDLTEAFNQFWKDSVADGSMMEIAQQYGVQESVITD